MRRTMILLCGLLAACSSSKSGGASGPEKACKDTAAAIATAAKNCGLDYQANYDAFVSGAAGGDCANVVSIRDEPSLRNDCIPFLKNLSCDQLNDPNLTLPATCQGQLLRQGPE